MLNGTLGFAMLIALLFCMPSDIAGTLEAVTFYPFMSIYTYAVGSTAGATAMVRSMTGVLYQKRIPQSKQERLMNKGLRRHRYSIFRHCRPRSYCFPHVVGIRT